MGTKLPRRINLLWVLAALLGTAAVHGTYRAIHHPEPGGEIMSHFAEVAAMFAGSVAEGRLQALARERLARDRESVPVLESFQVDPATGSVRRLAPPTSRVALPDSLLRPLPDVGGSLSLRFVSDGGGRDYAVLVVAQLDSAGTPAAGYGMVTDAAALAGRLFGPGQSDAGPGLLVSDLNVATESGRVLYQSPGPDEPFHATIRPGGPFDDLTITAGISLPRGLLSSLQNISRDQLWFSAVLLISAVIVVVIAAASSRREALLARARSDFIAGVSHELRMPLAQILLASETLALEREPDSAARLGLATSIVREARRLATLVDNVLLVARSGAVALHPTLTAVDVEDLFAEVGESVELAVEDAGQRLEVRPPHGLAVQGDRQLLRQALTNLVDNARKYGAPSQTIRLGADETASDGVHIYVENDGPSIPPAQRAKLFEPYERLPRDQTSERTGSGLGLSVVAQIARACGGTVRLEDSNPRGTRVVLALRAALPTQAT
jgi:signal transduction histidine kinase